MDFIDTSCEASLEKRFVKSATWSNGCVSGNPFISGSTGFFHFCEGSVTKGLLAAFCFPVPLLIQNSFGTEILSTALVKSSLFFRKTAIRLNVLRAARVHFSLGLIIRCLGFLALFLVTL